VAAVGTVWRRPTDPPACVTFVFEMIETSRAKKTVTFLKNEMTRERETERKREREGEREAAVGWAELSAMGTTIGWGL